MTSLSTKDICIFLSGGKFVRRCVFCGEVKVFLFLERCFENYFYFALDYEQGMIIGRMKGTLP